MRHMIYGDEVALLRYAVDDIHGLVAIPDVFDCEECQYVRESIAAWQNQAKSKCERGECECRIHTYVIGDTWPRL